uniref:deoxyribonuclease II n=1 Tax=Callorhinchus milii TaxID=7868 RepID=A0A4W3HRQ7_CALMI
MDRFVVYKLPRSRVNQSTGTGLEYMYLDSSTEGWQMSKHLVNMTKGAVGQTLEQLYRVYKSNDKNCVYFIYNDAAPEMKYDRYHGHAKGILLLDKTQGFWLIHSVPHFPPFPEQGYGWPSSARMFGQTLFCVTYKYSQFEEISKQLFYENPHVYNLSLPDAFQPELSFLQAIANGSCLTSPPWKRRTKLVSAGGQQFQSFAKYKNFGEDIYAAWLAQALETDLLAETWQRTKDALPSNCSLPQHVYNILRIKLPGSVVFLSHSDHSKWCVSQDYSRQWTCIGDINRTYGQMWRGGGLLCTLNPFIYKAFRHSVLLYRKCIDG